MASKQDSLSHTTSDDDVVYVGVQHSPFLPVVASSGKRDADNDADADDVVFLKRTKVAPAASAASSHAAESPRKHKRLFDCSVCLEGDLEGWTGYSLETCQHRFCISCLNRLVKAALTQEAVPQCPHSKCNKPLTAGDVHFVLQGDRSAWQQYQEKKSMALLETEIQQGSSTRRCPAAKCNYTFCFEPSGGVLGTAFACPQCKASFCLRCNAVDGKVGPAHYPGQSCYDRIEELAKQEDERKKLQQWQLDNAAADERFETLIQNEMDNGLTKPCPKCKAMVTKQGGCDHMHCSRCSHTYNWSTAKATI